MLSACTHSGVAIEEAEALLQSLLSGPNGKVVRELAERAVAARKSIALHVSKRRASGYTGVHVKQGAASVRAMGVRWPAASFHDVKQAALYYALAKLDIERRGTGFD